MIQEKAFGKNPNTKTMSYKALNCSPSHYYTIYAWSLKIYNNSKNLNVKGKTGLQPLSPYDPKSCPNWPISTIPRPFIQIL